MMIATQGLSFLLLRAIGVSDQQLLTLLQPFNGNYPADQNQYQLLQTSLRRMGHVLENNPGKIASVLRGRGPDSIVRAFMALDAS